MLKSLTFGGSLILIATTGFAQQTMRAQPVPGALKDAGVYNLATGTWSRGNNDTLGPCDILFRNDANTGFFGVFGVAADIIWTDEGSIPSTNDDEVSINTIQIAYCSSVVGGPQTGGLIFYEQYSSCTDIIGLTPNAAFGFTLPGGGSGTLCWLVTFDLTGTTDKFCMATDGEGTFDNTCLLDSFGWTLILNDQGSGGFNGPFLNGDPNNFPYGDGTKYSNCAAAYATGLCTVDQFWLNDITGQAANGCYWFGGYAGGNPFASFWLVLTGDKGCDNDWAKFCTANANSTGAAADIVGSGGTSASSGTVNMTSSPVPNQPGIFFHANNQNSIPFGCSFLCATGGTVRGAVISAAGNSATYTYDNSDVKHSLGAQVGLTRSFQYWYRDPMNTANCGGQTFNTSNAVTGTITP